MTVIALVLAAGAGKRAGGPKALRRTADGVPWVRLAVERMHMAGCAEVLVMLGAEADAAGALVPAEARVVRVDDWEQGASATLLAGLRAAAAGDADAVLVTLVDLPDATAAAAERVLDYATSPIRSALARAGFGGRPGHPVLIGRAHWPELAESLHGDAGARDYLAAHSVQLIECSDLETGNDVDH